MEKQNKKLLSVTVLLICLAGMAGIAVADGEKASAPQEKKRRRSMNRHSRSLRYGIRTIA